MQTTLAMKATSVVVIGDILPIL